jgi:NADPH:quinone reductase
MTYRHEVRAALIAELGAPPRRGELPDVPGGIEIEAVALNPLDVAVGSGRFYAGHPELPYPPGCEAAGRTEDGTPVYLFGAGRGSVQPGFLAERVSAPEELQLRLPDGIEPVLAAAAGIAGVAGWVPVAWKAKVTPEDRVLVLGASGVVGLVALQAAKLLGAAKVVAAGRDLGRLERARELGADETVDLDGIAAAFGAEGFTVCIDPLWGEPLAAALASAARHARIVHVGQSAGPEASLRSADVRSKELTIQGHSNFALSDGERNRAYLELLSRLLDGSIVIDVETYDLDHVEEAWARQQEGGGKKIVVTL